ncbi:hypothetical protein PILCRDRAFT_15609 [Piloderma croceum F 1598]|uniref:Uncharacterized protein n=1 Tax=Piloderma croceum (strain F 1598) TaxID=765440 RepID=A0A0C3EZ54_PILCF|nr:hypothetical protein PILCRDRAFT_15609 [Piloderma croceum F 1598]
MKEWVGDVGSGDEMYNILKYADQLKQVCQEHETAPIETPRTIITYPDGTITLWSDDIQLEYQALIYMDTTICLNSTHSSFRDDTLSVGRLERITVEIVDLGNGLPSLHIVTKLCAIESAENGCATTEEEEEEEEEEMDSGGREIAYEEAGQGQGQWIMKR